HLRYKGGETVKLEFPEERSPIFVRLGAIIPLDVANDAVKHGTAASKGWRTLDIYPASQPSSAVVWDTRQFPPSAFRDRSFVTVKPMEKGTEIRLEAGPVQDTIFRVWRTQAPAAVRVDQTAVDKLPGSAEWEKSKRGWWYDAADQRLWIRLAG